MSEPKPKFRQLLASKLSRKDALQVACPKCKSAPGMRCIGKRLIPNIRSTPHMERYEAAALRREWNRRKGGV